MVRKFLMSVLITATFASNAQVFFSDDFNDGNLNGWTNIDDDADPTVNPPFDNTDLWYTTNTFINLTIDSDSTAAISNSQAQDPMTGNFNALNPNNYLISSLINLTTAPTSNLFLKFQTGSAQVTGGHSEHYAVYVTTANTIAAVNAATPVFEETLPSGAQMFSHSIDISSYAGQQVYVTIRHFDCTAEFALLLDNVIVEGVLEDNAAIQSIDLNRYSLTNTNNELDINIENLGAKAITSIEIDWNDGASNISTISGLNLAPFGKTKVTHPLNVNYATVVEKEIVVTINKVNTVVDTDLDRNTADVKFNTISQHSDKKVVFEEGTGTWCPSCPAGHVMMEEMDATYSDDFIGIAVHVNDIMTDSVYQTGTDFIAAPTIHVDRKFLDQDTDDAVLLYNRRSPMEVPASLSSVVTGSGNNISINASATFRSVFTKTEYRLGVIIIEDDVTGTSSDYDQANVYSGGGYGPMGGYENLTDPVPAGQMVYNHVGRALLGGYKGQLNSVASTITDGQVNDYSFNYTLPSGADIDNFRAVVVLLDVSTGEIVNAHKTKLEFTDNISEDNFFETNVYPNPTTDILNVNFEGNGGSYIVTIFNQLGKQVYLNSLGTVNGNSVTTISTEELQNGNYFINISTEGKSSTKKITVQ